MTSKQNDGENEATRPSNKEMQADTPPSNPPSVDPERIAALIDGRLDATERAALLAELDASPEALEAYADAVAALPEIAGEPLGSIGMGSSASPGTHRPFRASAPAIALAAVLLIAVALPLARRTRGPALDTPQTIAALLRPTGDAATVWQRTPWSELRGTSDALSARARGVRIGARIVDLELLARASDTSAAQVALQVASLLDGIPAGGVAASAYRDLDGQAGVPPDADLTRAASFAEQVAGAAEVRSGAWLEAARVAAAARDESFFTSSRVRDAEQTIASLAGLPPSAHSALTELTRLLAASTRDWPAIENALDTLLRDAASG